MVFFEYLRYKPCFVATSSVTVLEEVKPSFHSMDLCELNLDDSTASNVEIELPVPADASTPAVRTSMGTAVYAPEKEALIWKIKSFPGGKVPYLVSVLHIMLLKNIAATNCICK